MLKSKLIQLLEKIPGDFEVQIYNGIVEDIMEIDKLSQCNLVRMKEDIQKELAKLQGEPGSNLNREWNLETGLETHIIHEYQPIIIIEPKPSGKTCHDRMGIISY